MAEPKSTQPTAQPPTPDPTPAVPPAHEAAAPVAEPVSRDVGMKVIATSRGFNNGEIYEKGAELNLHPKHALFKIKTGGAITPAEAAKKKSDERAELQSKLDAHDKKPKQ